MEHQMKSLSFASLAYEQKKKKTRREQFLEEMDKVIPWESMVKTIKPHYPKAGNGRKPMLRIYFLQQWYGLSDPAMEDSLYDIESMRRFAGIDLQTDDVPDETTILHFRHLLEKHKLTEKLFAQTRRYLIDKGLMVREGTIVDATILNAPSSTKNSEQARDPEMKQTKKGNQWYFGMKAHVGTDTGKGLVHSIVVTNAAVHDSKVMDYLLHGEEKAVYGDKAYDGKDRQEDYEASGIEWRVKRKANRHYSLTEEDKEFNRLHGKVRAKVEHAFQVVKHLWKYRKVRYKGLYKNVVQVYSLFTLANLYLVRKELQVGMG
jgi:IS5 family transposase